MSSTLRARAVGAIAGILIAALVAGAPLGQWWSDILFGGLSVGTFAIPTAALLGAWRGPRLNRADHRTALREAIVVTLVGVPVGTILIAVFGAIEIAASGSGYPLLAPLGLSATGVLIVGPAVLLAAIPGAVLWAEVVRLGLRHPVRPGP